MAIGVVSSRQLGDARMLFEIVELFRCHGRLDFATGIAKLDQVFLTLMSLGNLYKQKLCLWQL